MKAVPEAERISPSTHRKVSPDQTISHDVQTDREERGTKASSSWSTLWLSDRDVTVFTVLAILLLVLIGLRWVQVSGFGRKEIEIERLQPIEYAYRLDLNTATWIEFAQLESVGETLAMRIVEDREKNGPFSSIDDLDRVKGIGPKTLDRLRPFLQVKRSAPLRRSGPPQQGRGGFRGQRNHNQF